MKFTIVCYVNDYAICKDESGEIFNLEKEKVDGFKEGDVINMSEDGEIVKDEETVEDEEKYYICDDVVIFYND
ncbi:hypothetical protein Ccar_17005 [Clostridium carboxidivorans P7]|uniref:Uncharacterized protein n=1 Tax=Clostridium carboxidivorans P7 TaxID=536227 RepID=C6Q0K2_9CLOT|nr:hypothetical protein [Clostridium carboxidivorans]AKN32462.1 hypothetical protein Ccar_17005 [Clostridium carboxidivorans P7]EET84972.1 hypothetical protein CcarbDRAFT_4569 [Clostridium carboxidivorans P7]EFG87662.1 hypothetical protein CLCAR_2672 [Clostridium carboxidivorans P7]